MSSEQVSVFDIDAEVDRYFDDSSLALEGKPRMVFLMGGVASGKTTTRKQRYATGYVLVDAAEIFLSLSRGEFYPFPDAFEEPMNTIGVLVAHRAISERRHIVTELIPMLPIEPLYDAINAIGYHLDAVYIECDPKVGWQRNLNRGDDNISCCYAEPFQRGWLLAAAHAALNPD